MGDISPPTAADYAWSAANQASDENKKLRERVEYLERRLGHLITALKKQRIHCG